MRVKLDVSEESVNLLIDSLECEVSDLKKQKNKIVEDYNNILQENCDMMNLLRDILNYGIDEYRQEVENIIDSIPVCG